MGNGQLPWLEEVRLAPEQLDPETEKGYNTHTHILAHTHTHIEINTCRTLVTTAEYAVSPATRRFGGIARGFSEVSVACKSQKQFHLTPILMGHGGLYMLRMSHKTEHNYDMFLSTLETKKKRALIGSVRLADTLYPSIILHYF